MSNDATRLGEVTQHPPPSATSDATGGFVRPDPNGHLGTETTIISMRTHAVTASEMRAATRPLRPAAIMALLAGNAILLLVGVGQLLFARVDWAAGFGLRSTQAFPLLAGPTAIALPLAAILLATHVEPVLASARLITAVAVAQFGVSLVFGGITYLWSFAHELSSGWATLLGLASRSVWLGLLIFATVIGVRVVERTPPGPQLIPRPRPAAGGAVWPLVAPPAAPPRPDPGVRIQPVQPLWRSPVPADSTGWQPTVGVPAPIPDPSDATQIIIASDLEHSPTVPITPPAG